MKKFFIGKAAMAMAVAAATGAAVMPMAVFAEDVTPVSHVENPGAETYTTTAADGTGSWGTDDGRVDLTYDTTAGKWKDAKDLEHDNGTYVVRIPKAIKYVGMHVGKVTTNDDYSVTVEGVLAPGKSVSVSAETGKTVAIHAPATDDDNITEVTSMKGTDTSNTAGAYSKDNKRTFSAKQVSVMDDAGKVTGTTVTDNISMSGKAYSAGTYTGTVQYTASLN